jgi:DNA-binding transcriptional LysR family regulator
MFDRACQYAGLRIGKMVESDSTQTLLALANSGMGIAVVSSTAVSQWQDSEVVPLTLNGYPIEEVVSAVRNAKRHQPAVLQVFQSELSTFLRHSPEGQRFRQYVTTLI